MVVNNPNNNFFSLHTVIQYQIKVT